MNSNDILTAVNAGEDKDWEFKSAKGGMLVMAFPDTPGHPKQAYQTNLDWSAE